MNLLDLCQPQVLMFVYFKITICIFLFSFFSGKETEKAKDRCDKATMKLHMLHNQYVLALKGAQLHQHQYYDTTLPLLLDSLQKMQEEMIKAL